jgi:putative Ca2+/H+ antiporter (TMEM165/GDT1 family)
MVTEFGDDTFVLAAIMAMRHPGLAVYVGAASAEIFMTVSCSSMCMCFWRHMPCGTWSFLCSLIFTCLMQPCSPVVPVTVNREAVWAACIVQCCAN